MCFWKISPLPQKLTIINLCRTLHSTTWPLHLSEPWLRKWALQLQLILKSLLVTECVQIYHSCFNNSPCWFASNSVTNTIWRSNASLHKDLLNPVGSRMWICLSLRKGQKWKLSVLYSDTWSFSCKLLGECRTSWGSVNELHSVIYGGFWFGKVAECEGGQNRSHMMLPTSYDRQT